MALTDREVAAAKATDGRRLEIADDQVPGLALRVTTSGVKSWALRYRVGGGRAGRMRRLTLGVYPTVGLARARKKAQEALRAVDGGEDPAADKQSTRTGETVGDLSKDYIDKYAKVKKRSWLADQRYLDIEILPTWKHRKVKELTRRDVRELIEKIADRGSPISANRCLALVRKMLNFGVSKDWLLRRTASTKMAAAGVSQADIARVLNHVEDGPRATAVYNRYAYDLEKRVALETWERELVRILATSAAGGDVVPFVKRKRAQ